MNNKTQSALIGGAMLGILSAIPFVNIANVCCCLWAIAGGALAAYLYIKRSAADSLSVSIGDGAMLGGIAGLIGAAIYIVIGIPLNYVAGNAMMGMLLNVLDSADPAQAEVLRAQMAQGQSFTQTLLTGLLWGLMLVIFSVVGGVLSVVIFGKRYGGMNNQTPQPPTNQSGV
ncbi:MAG: hypothetical protein MSG64_05030 [Pyrinomonadaceae bacterium MAG19_C2-C3]|nr:hypothetical protein [Pyrinomonadaceae bacterium MAG19_C2-C3]